MEPLIDTKRVTQELVAAIKAMEVRIRESLQEPYLPWIMMALIEGSDLTDRLKEDGVQVILDLTRWTEGEVVNWLVEGMPSEEEQEEIISRLIVKMETVKRLEDLTEMLVEQILMDAITEHSYLF